MKCGNSAFNAQGSRLIILVVHLNVQSNETYYSNCTGRSSENICGSRAHENGKTG
jgi:hypothetical protein